MAAADFRHGAKHHKMTWLYPSQAFSLGTADTVCDLLCTSTGPDQCRGFSRSGHTFIQAALLFSLGLFLSFNYTGLHACIINSQILLEWQCCNYGCLQERE